MDNFPRLGNFFEALVVEELIRGFSCTSLTNLEYFHFRTKAGGEIDLVVTGSIGIVPIEIKYSSFVRKEQATALVDFVEHHNLPLGIVFSNCAESSLVSERVVQLPVGII